MIDMLQTWDIFSYV